MSLNWAEGESMLHLLLWVSCPSDGLGFLPHFVRPGMIVLNIQRLQFTAGFGKRGCWSKQVCFTLDRWSEEQNWDPCFQEQGRINRHSGVRLTFAATSTLLKEEGTSTADDGIMRETANHHCLCYHYLVLLLLPSDIQTIHMFRRSWVRVTTTATYRSWFFSYVQTVLENNLICKKKYKYK